MATVRVKVRVRATIKVKVRVRAMVRSTIRVRVRVNLGQRMCTLLSTNIGKYPHDKYQQMCSQISTNIDIHRQLSIFVDKYQQRLTLFTNINIHRHFDIFDS